jgi:hypothetical protein
MPAASGFHAMAISGCSVSCQTALALEAFGDDGVTVIGGPGALTTWEDDALQMHEPSSSASLTT